MQKLTLLMMSVFLSGLSFAQNSIIRTPSLSPDAQHLAFSFQGDIWVYNFEREQSQRLTVHQAYESNPVWSPDGSELVFASNRKGYVDLFKVALKGGNPDQLTYYPASDYPSAWTEDSGIIFSTSRLGKGAEKEAEVFAVSSKGGTPQRMMQSFGTAAVLSPNGKFIAFEKGYCRIAREDYDGPAQRDIYVYNKETGAYHQITNSTKNDHSPRFDAQGNLYFISASSGRYNVYAATLDDQGKTDVPFKALTNEEKNGVISYDVSDNGSLFYNAGFEYHLIDSSGESKALTLSFDADQRFDDSKHMIATRGMRDFDVSPNNKLIAYELDGEIFVKKNDKENTFSNNVSKSDARDQSPRWISDEVLMFVSDRSGQNELHFVSSSEKSVGLERSLKLSTKKVTQSSSDVFNPSVSPNGKKVGFQIGRGDYVIAYIKEGGLDAPKLMSQGWAAPSGVSWSPDSNFIAYSQNDLDFDTEVFIQSVLDPSKKYNVSMHPRSDRNPVWSPDGRKLAFVSNRNGTRGGGANYDVWMVFLRNSDWEKTMTDFDQGSYYPEEESKDASVQVTIDSDEIYNRLWQVTSLVDDERNPVFSTDSKNIYFTATNPTSKRSNVFKINWNGKSGKEVKGASSPFRIKAYKKDLFILSASGLKQLNPKTDKLASRPYKAEYDIHFKARNAQVFDEGVRALTAGFYDPQFHGYDWTDLVKVYRPWALEASTKQDFSFVYNLMLGQLNASHMGYRGSTPEKTNSDQIGLLGVEVKNSPKGYVIEYVLPGSIADKSKARLKKGDVITLINGEKPSGNTNFYSYFRNQIDKEMLIEIDGEKELVLRAESSSKERLLAYNAWVKESQKLVDEYSDGTLGYIHIKGMNLPSFESFERELKAAGYGKKGLVIDVRFNGGGWTTDRLMAVLNVQQHAYTVPRGATGNLEKNNKDFKGHYPFNERAILSVNTKPIVALCNEFSYSNAEIFAHAVKSLDLGSVVGQPTFGAVISTGSARLLDGYVRMPFRAWYVKESGLNMEHGPAVPDYIVTNPPGSRARGEDPQLKKAVEVLMSEIE
ncbi:MAG: S41 family peptidase [Flavobacteriaceae bacterium]